jgi:hypothetical protein
MRKTYILIIIVSFLTNCNDKRYAEGKIETKEVTDITSGTATLEGSISITTNPKKKITITKRGFVYAEKNQQTLKTVYDEINSTGDFFANISGLKPSTNYYAQAFFELGYDDWFYGNIINFTTNSNISPPSLTTLSATNVTHNTATLGGNISNAGTPAYTERGICYATTQNPTTSNYKIAVSGSGLGSYTTNVSSLNPNTTYYVRAYAINSGGTAYGSQITFKTETNASNAQVRFQKTKDYMYVTEMTVDNLSGYELASYYFGTYAGTSNYYTIPSGQHVLWYYYTYPGQEGWEYCLNYPYTYNFQAGQKYTVVCDDDGSYLIFYVTNDGSAKSSEYDTPKEIISPVLRIPKKQVNSLYEKPRADVLKVRK